MPGIGPAAISAEDPLMPYSREPIQVLIKPVLIQTLSQPVVRSIPNSLDYHHCCPSTDPAAALVSARFHGVINDSDTSSDAQHHVCEHAGPPRLRQLLLNVCFQLLPQTLRTGSSTPLPPDNGNRVGGIAETGHTQWDIPRLPVVPDRGSPDRGRFVSEASRLCHVPVGPQASPVQAVLR